MSKKWKEFRSILAHVGYTTVESASGVVLTNIVYENNNWYFYYTDQFSNQVKATYDTTVPIVVNSDTQELTISIGASYLAGISGYTTTVQITNENNLDVTSECTFTPSNMGVYTGGTYGQLLTALASGTTIISIVHEDYDPVINPGASATTSVTVGQFNAVINPSGGTLDTDGDGVFLTTTNGSYYMTTGATVQNQSNELVTTSTAVLRYTIDGGAATLLTTPYVGGSRGATSTMVIYDVNARTFNPVVMTGATYSIVRVGAQDITGDDIKYLAGLSSWTASYSIRNELAADVTSQCTYNQGSTDIVLTSGTYGQDITARSSGTTTMDIVHIDYNGTTNPLASGLTSVVVGQMNTALVNSAITIDGGGTGDTFTMGQSAVIPFSALTLKNQDDEYVGVDTAKLWVSISGVSGDIKTYIDENLPASGATGWIIGTWPGEGSDIFQATNKTGVEKLTIYDYNAKAYNPIYTGLTYTVTLV